jgi:hypothetical protein
MQRLAFLTLLILCLLAPVNAQTEGELALFGASDQVAYVVYQQAQDANITRNADGTATFALSGVPSDIIVIQTRPTQTLVFKVQELVESWATQLASIAEGEENPYTALAEVRFAEGVFFLTIVGVSYDAETGTLFYTATIDQYLPKLAGTTFDLSAASETKKFPNALGSAQVVFSGQSLFWQLARGDNALSSIRDGNSAPCRTANEERTRLQSLYDGLQLRLFLHTSGVVSLSSAEVSDITAMLSKAQQDLTYVNSWLAANC